MTDNSIQPPSMFTKLLRIIYRDFMVVSDTDHKNGYRQQRYSDGQDTYEIDSYEGQPRTIRRPKAVEYYSSGGKQEF